MGSPAAHQEPIIAFQKKTRIIDELASYPVRKPVLHAAKTGVTMVSEESVSITTASISPEFVISVTGHRDIAEADRSALEQQLETIFSDIQGRFRYLEVRLVTGLAESADTIAADVALRMGLAVTAVLPMPMETYAEDFSGAALTKFRDLAAADGVTVLELPVADGKTAADLSEPANRDAQYAMLRDYIIRRSNLLVALWDGNDTGLEGGTSDVVLGYLGGRTDTPPARVEMDAVMTGDCGDVVIWLPARRISNPDVDLPPEPVTLISNSNGDCYWQNTEIPEDVWKRWSGLDDFTGDRLSDKGRDLPAYGLIPDDATNCSADALALNAEFIRADQLAQANQAQSDRMFKLFGLMAGAMGFFFLVYAKLLAAKLLLIIYIALFALGFIGFRVSARYHWLSHHLAYRAMAETLRVQFFLMMSGAGERYQLRRILQLISVDRFQRFEWLQDAVRCAEPLVYFGHDGGMDAIETTRKQWVEDQANYFKRKLHDLHHQHHRLEIIKNLLLAGSVLGALSLIFFKKTLLHLDMMGYDGKAWLVFFMGLLPLWVAVWELYQGKMATRELLWQYTNQHRYFAAAAKQLQSTETAAEGRQIIRDLADKALIEIYLWSVHRFHREHEPPAAG